MVRLAVPVLLTALCAVASAQPKPDPEGAKLFEEGRALAKDGKYAEACQRFERSLELDPAIGTQLNYADCNEKLSRFVDAWRLFDAAAEAEKVTNPARAKFARERADALLPRLGVIVLRLATPDAPMLAVSIAGRSVKPAAVIHEIVTPGEVSIAVTAAGNPPFQRSEKLAAGKTVTIDVPAFTSASPTTEEPPRPDEEPRRSRSRVLLAYGIGGAGVVTFVTGVVLGIKARGDYNAQFDSGNCRDDSSGPVCNMAGFDAQNDAVSLANVGTVLGVGGLALIAGGAVLYLTAPKTPVVVAPTATAQSAGLSVIGWF